MKDGTKLYIMNISKTVYRKNDLDAYAKEVWIYKPSIGSQFLSSNQKNSELAVLVDDLYETYQSFQSIQNLRVIYVMLLMRI